jgi:hypothetical protein
MEKIFNHKSFGHFWEVELTYKYSTFLPSSLLQGLSSLILFPLFASGVVDTGGKFAAGFIDTGGKFATGINNTSKTSGKICHRCR